MIRAFRPPCLHTAVIHLSQDWDHRHEGWMEYMTPDAVEDGETPKKKKKKKKRGAR